ncbi:hypothetical protein MYX76_18165 [Desulfobacterota bacterium AH_259_B03_O07]|nr:hypothetical protein [Desulfobacterota bacterium AH_259_B03_O07]
MSLIISVYVPTGIILSGDSRTTGTISQQDKDPKNPNNKVTVRTNIVISDAADKVFLLYNRFGVGAFGDAIVKDMPIAHYIEQFHLTTESPSTPEDLAQSLLKYLRSQEPTANVGLVVAGYENNEPFVIGVNVKKGEAQRMNIKKDTGALDYGILRGGDTAVVNRLLSQREFNPVFTVMNIQDAVDYSRHLIRSSIDQMRFEPRFPKVGGPIDTLVITTKDSRFLTRKSVQ